MNFVDAFDQMANVAQMVRKCPTPVLRRAYVTAMRDWCRQTQWLRIAVSGATGANTALYNLGSDTYLEIIGVYAMSASQTVGGNTQTWPVIVSDSGNWDPNMPTGTPGRYAYVPEGQIALNPTPDGVYSVLTTAIVQPKEGVTQVPEAPLRKYGTCFEAGALAYLLAMNGTPWFNPNEAMRQGRVFAAEVSNGKAEVQRNFNTGSQRVRPRPLFR